MTVDRPALRYCFPAKKRDTLRQKRGSVGAWHVGVERMWPNCG
jgi:hypothetical protein